MMSLQRTALAITASLAMVVLFPPTAQAQSKKKKGEQADYKVVIYDDENFRGRNVVVRKDVANLDTTAKFSDHSESLQWKLAPGRAAVLFDDKDFDRPVLVLVGQGELEDLGKQQPNALHRVTSVAFVPHKKGARPRGLSRDVPMVGSEE